MSESITLASALTYHRGPRVILDGITFKAPVGICAIVGPNGAGKTTLFECIAGLLRPTSGHTLGQDGNAKRIGYVPQDPVLPRGVRVMEALQYAAWLRGQSWRVSKSAAASALSQVDLESQAKARIGTLSGGMRRRLAVAVALAQTPIALLLDESLVGLDPVQRSDLIAILRRLGESLPIVISTHVLTDIIELDGYVVALDQGRMLKPEALGTLIHGKTTNPLSALQDWYLASTSR